MGGDPLGGGETRVHHRDPAPVGSRARNSAKPTIRSSSKPPARSRTARTQLPPLPFFIVSEGNTRVVIAVAARYALRPLSRITGQNSAPSPIATRKHHEQRTRPTALAKCRDDRPAGHATARCASPATSLRPTEGDFKLQLILEHSGKEWRQLTGGPNSPNGRLIDHFAAALLH